MHNHNDEPMFTADGVHAVEPYLAAWGPVLERHPDALLYPTMAAGARGIPVARRWAHVEELGPGEPSNLDLLRAAVALVEGLGRAPATTAQARRILGVPSATRSPLASGS